MQHVALNAQSSQLQPRTLVSHAKISGVSQGRCGPSAIHLNRARRSLLSIIRNYLPATAIRYQTSTRNQSNSFSVSCHRLITTHHSVVSEVLRPFRSRIDEFCRSGPRTSMRLIGSYGKLSSCLVLLLQVPAQVLLRHKTSNLAR